MQPEKMVAGNSFRTRSHNSWGTLYGRQGARAENSPLLFRKTGQIGNKPFEKPLLFRKTGQIGNKPFEKPFLFRKTAKNGNKLMAETTTRPVARAGCETVESRSCKKGRRQGAGALRWLAGAFPGEPFLARTGMTPAAAWRPAGGRG